MQPFLNTRFSDYERILSIIKGLGDFLRFICKTVLLLFSSINVNYLHFLGNISRGYSQNLKSSAVGDLLNVKFFF